MKFTISIESFYLNSIIIFYKNLKRLLFFNTFLSNNNKLSFWSLKFFVLPKKIKKHTLLRSPHVNKKSREQFETRTYKAIIHVIPLINLNKSSEFIAIYILKKFIDNSLTTSLSKYKLVVNY